MDDYQLRYVAGAKGILNVIIGSLKESSTIEDVKKDVENIQEYLKRVEQANTNEEIAFISTFYEDKFQTKQPLTQKGLALHLHHGLLIEWCHSYKERVDYIKKYKLKSEQKTRLKLFKMLSSEAIADLPKYLVKADRKWKKADRKREKAYRKWNEANHKWDKASHKLIEARRIRDETNHKWVEVNRKWVEASRKREKAYRKWDEAYRKRFEADRKWDKAYNRWLNTKGARKWHDKHCGCKEWDWEKKEIIFK